MRFIKTATVCWLKSPSLAINRARVAFGIPHASEAAKTLPCCSINLSKVREGVISISMFVSKVGMPEASHYSRISSTGFFPNFILARVGRVWTIARAMGLALRPPLTSTLLADAVEHAEDERPFLVDGLLYDKASLLVSGDPGAGKSLVQLSAFAQCTAGLPVFDQLPCKRPLNCYILFSERINQEALERMRLIRTRVPINYRRLVLDDGFVGIADVSKKEFANEIIDRIGKAKYEEDNGKTDLVGLDSLYGFIPGGLSKDERASEFARFISRLISELSVSSWLVHHTSRPVYSTNGEQVAKDDPYYGSQWLKAMVTGSYYLHREGDGVKMTKKKDTFGALLSQIPLDYDPQTHVVSLSSDHGTLHAIDRAVCWLQRIAHDSPDREFTFEELCKAVNVSHQHGRRLLKEKSVTSRLVESRKQRLKVLYRAVNPSLETDP